MSPKWRHPASLRRLWLAAAMTLAGAAPLVAEEASELPTPTPATRPEMKAALEALSTRQPRIPLSESADGQGAPSYVPTSWGGGMFGVLGQTTGRGVRDRRGEAPDPHADALFTDPAFWVVSRANNCHYCLGHQELKLRAGGLDDDAIAALDSDWSRFDPRQQTVLALARKLTLEPALVGDADIAALRDHLSDGEVIELAFAIAQFNGINRWTGALGLPQETYRDEQGESAFETPTSARFADAVSIVTPETRTPRGPAPSPAEIAAAIAACRARDPRVRIPATDDAARGLAGAIGDRPPLAWECALSALPTVGKSYVLVWNTMAGDDHLAPRLKAELAYITAVHNSAWCGAALAADRLADLGAVPDEVAALISDPPMQTLAPAAVAHAFAAKLTVDPHLITDGDVARLRDQFSDAEAAQIIYVICLANVLDRLTLSLGLPPE